MDKIKKEIDATSNPWIKKIGNYLLSREDVLSKLDNPKKSLLIYGKTNLNLKAI